ncbi:MAG: glycosyltransferase family 2 protein [Gaiellaceae bacterium]
MVRVVIPSRNAVQLLLRCLESLACVDWPREPLEVVVVDNASTDGTAKAVADRFGAKVIRAPRNLGFAGGCNLGLEDLDGVDFVALLNNDALVEPGWLRPLVAALDTEKTIGAAAPKILFADRFVEVTIESEGGVRLEGVRPRAQFVSGFCDHGLYRMLEPEALIRLPAGREAKLRLSAPRPQRVVLQKQPTDVGPEPSWVTAPTDGEPVDVINSAGCVHVRGGYGADRGYLEVDRGQYDQPAEVFAWSGASVLLSREYLEDVGGFDARFFVYYEDFDLSWRGRALGWRYLYAPDAVVRHVHAATSGEGSELFQHYVERNRLLVHAKNAPARYAARVLGSSLRETGGYIVNPAPIVVRRRLRSLAGFAAQLPHALRERRRLRRRRRVPEDEVNAWLGSGRALPIGAASVVRRA